MSRIGLLVIRIVLGGLMAGQGTRKLLGWFGGPGPDGAGRALHAMGYRRGRTMAVLAGATELGSGIGLVLGAGTPVAAAGVIGEMVNAGGVHAAHGLWAEDGGFEYPLVLATAAAGVAWDGGGPLSVDRALGLDLSGPRWGVGAAALGVATGLATFVAFRARAHDAPARDLVDVPPVDEVHDVPGGVAAAGDVAPRHP